MRVFVLLPLLLTGSLLLASDNVVKQKANGNRLLTLFEPQDGETRAIPFTSTGTVEPGRTVQGFVIDPVNSPNTLIQGTNPGLADMNGNWTLQFNGAIGGPGRIVRVETVDGQPEEFDQAVIHIMPMGGIKPQPAIGAIPRQGVQPKRVKAKIQCKNDGLTIAEAKRTVAGQKATVQVSGTMTAGTHPIVHGLLLDKAKKTILVGTTRDHGKAWFIEFQADPKATYIARVRSLDGKQCAEKAVVDK